MAVISIVAYFWRWPQLSSAVGLVLVREPGDLRALGLADHLGRHRGAASSAPADTTVSPSTRSTGAQLDLALGRAEALDVELLPFGDPVLLSTGEMTAYMS